jgi:hypothetical protein
MFNPSLPKWVKVWFVIIGVMVLYDSSFVLNRPNSLPGYPLSKFWGVFSYYLPVDKSFGDMKNSFLVAWSYINAVEAALSFLAVYRNGEPIALILGLLASCVSLTKTSLFLLNELAGGMKGIGHNALFDMGLWYILPWGLFMVVPAAVAFTLASQMLTKLEVDEDFTKEQRQTLLSSFLTLMKEKKPAQPVPPLDVVSEIEREYFGEAGAWPAKSSSSSPTAVALDVELPSPSSGKASDTLLSSATAGEVKQRKAKSQGKKT